ncbi:MAG: SGNH/GDSL hydrolase family protein [Ruminococcaceae bacterium]|nr:SGNH/GDSL hydrolase family protein [Oscillospiraceae bacterium]
MSDIILFGDSIMKGVVFDAVKKRYYQIKNCFSNLFFAGSNRLVKNFASFGCTVTKGLSIVRKKLEDITCNNCVALEFGGNDCNFNWEEISKNPEAEHLPVTPVDEFADNYLKLIEEVKSKGTAPVLFNLPPLVSTYFFRQITEGLIADNILIWLGGNIDTTRLWHKSYSDTVEEISKLKDLRLLDIRSAFVNEGDYREYFCKDGMHPNEKGHKLMGEHLAKTAPDFVV